MHVPSFIPALAVLLLAPTVYAQSCFFQFGPTSATVTPAGASGTIPITAQAGCTWVAVSNVPWITTTSTGSGNGTVSYTVAPNGGSARQGAINIGNASFNSDFLVMQQTSQSDVILNGGFEAPMPWVQGSSGGYAIINNEPVHAYLGLYAAWFGGYHNGLDTLYQDITIPANAAVANLQFMFRIDSEETATQARDILVAAVLDPSSGATLASLGGVSNLDAGGSWRRTAAMDLTAFRGRTVRLLFAATTDSQALTSFRIDEVSLLVTPGPTTPRLTNISTRMKVSTGDDVLIGGFVIGGTGSKRVAIVATGPSLSAYGITNPLANPTLTIVRASDQAVIASNNDWSASANAFDIAQSPFKPVNDLESAILIDLAPGAYTAIVQGAGGTTGVAVIGVYEVDDPGSPVVNISTRGRVLTGDDVMIGGFVIHGTAPQTVAIVATGPSLAAHGVSTPLANPMLRLVRSSDQAVIATNDDWQSHANSAQLQAAGFAPSNPVEAGLYVTLQPGAYTAIVEGSGGGTGVAVIGVYKVN